MLPQPRRRWACFPGSVISDYENPAAHLYRAMARHIVGLQDEVRFYEERANPWLRKMLLNDGAEAFRTFQQRHSDVSYVTYELRTGAELADWINRVLATIDLVVVDRFAPPEIVRFAGELTRPRLQTFLLDTSGHTEAVFDEVGNIEQFTGICVADTGGNVRLPSASDQSVIRFGPVDSESISNGDAATHIDRTAENLVSRIAIAADETLVGNRDSSSTFPEPS